MKNALVIRKQRKEIPSPNSNKRYTDYKSTLFNKQEGRCEFCNLLLQDQEDPYGDLDLERAVIHHVIPLSSGGSNDLKNLSLLHEDCHRILHQKVGKSSTYLMKYRKSNKKGNKA